jgi:hypothetical protein
LKRVLFAIAKTVAELQDLPLTRRQFVKHLLNLLAQQVLGGDLFRSQGISVFDQVAKRRAPVLVRGHLQRECTLGNPDQRLDLFNSRFQGFRQFPRIWLAAQLLGKAVQGLRELIELFIHQMHRQADSTPVVGDGAGNRLADPPRRIGTELEAAAIVEFLGGSDQTNVSSLDQIGERYTAADVLLGDADDQTGFR